MPASAGATSGIPEFPVVQFVRHQNEGYGPAGEDDRHLVARVRHPARGRDSGTPSRSTGSRSGRRASGARPDDRGGPHGRRHCRASISSPSTTGRRRKHRDLRRDPVLRDGNGDRKPGWHAGPGNAGRAAPGPGTLVPVGSSIVIQATSTPADGFVAEDRLLHRLDRKHATSTLIGTGHGLPVFGHLHPGRTRGRHPLDQGRRLRQQRRCGRIEPRRWTEITLTMTTANSGPLPTCTVFTPQPSSLLEIPDYAANAAAAIPVIVTAGPGRERRIIQQGGALHQRRPVWLPTPPIPTSSSGNPSVTGAYRRSRRSPTTTSATSSPRRRPSASSNSPAATNVTIESAPAVDDRLARQRRNAELGRADLHLGRRLRHELGQERQPGQHIAGPVLPGRQLRRRRVQPTAGDHYTHHVQARPEPGQRACRRRAS